MAELAAVRLRPEGMRSKPVYMDRVFDDPDAVLRLIREGAPYRTVGAYLEHGLIAGGMPWFLDRPDHPMLVENPNWFAAAREAFGAQIVKPIHVTLNVNGPAPLALPHVDQPAFRGFTDAQAPIWLLMAMSRSRLFLPWLVPVASGLVWFWRGEGGEFEYWPEGPEGEPVRVEPPMWNTGVMSDNEVMWHRVGAFGPEERQQKLMQVRASALADWTGDGWGISQDGETLMRLAPDEMRIALLWKAYVFRDEAHLASFEDSRLNLDMEQVIDIFCEDLARRGLPSGRPADPAADAEWRELLESAYVTPFG